MLLTPFATFLLLVAQGWLGVMVAWSVNVAHSVRNFPSAGGTSLVGVVVVRSVNVAHSVRNFPSASRVEIDCQTGSQVYN